MNKILQTNNSNILLQDAIEDKEDVINLTTIFITNLLGQVSVLGAFTGTAKDYYDAKVAKKREREINSFLNKMNDELKGVKLKQEAIEYFENSLIFHLEEIYIKLSSDPDKSFDEVFSTFIAETLKDVETPPEDKDLVLSTLLSLDKTDLVVFKQVLIQFNLNLNQGNQRGAEVHQLEQALNTKGLSRLSVSRSIQRLQSQDLIHPISNNTAQIEEGLSVQELHKGRKSKQFYPSSGYIISEFGNLLMRLSGLSPFK